MSKDHSAALQENLSICYVAGRQTSVAGFAWVDI